MKANLNVASSNELQSNKSYDYYKVRKTNQDISG